MSDGSIMVKVDSILHYNVGKWGAAGYCVPNAGNDGTTVNSDIVDLTNQLGKNLYAIMQDQDINMARYPSFDTILKVHALYDRAVHLLDVRGIPVNERRPENDHARPAIQDFLVYPVPYLNVRNPFMRRWCEYVLKTLTNCFQHTENQMGEGFSGEFADSIHRMLHRVYYSMATELFGKTRDEAKGLDFRLTDEELRSYDPTAFFTSTEHVETVPPFKHIFTEDENRVLAAGIPFNSLPATVQPISRDPDDTAGNQGGGSASNSGTPRDLRP